MPNCLAPRTAALAADSKYESCGYPRLHAQHADFNPIYPAAGRGGRVFNLFKILLSNHCRRDCLYCVNRLSRSCPRYRFAPEELANLFMQYYRRHLARGLFISSAIDGSTNRAQEKLVQAIRILRLKYRYPGYIHCKILPGADLRLILEAARYSDRLSINLESPHPKYLKNIAPSKRFNEDLFKRLQDLAQLNKEQPLKNGITTQLVVGSGEESDREILDLSHRLYTRLRLRRVYYSGFIPVKATPLENKTACSKWREFRLYQADWLLREYAFRPEELIFNIRGNLQLDLDPKLAWAIHNYHKFPREINQASLTDLLKIPGIGRTSAMKIMSLRNHHKINELRQLTKLRINIKRVKDFVCLDGKFFGEKKIHAKPVNNFALIEL